MIDYNGKIFRAIENTANGETTAETIFQYQQENDILSAQYEGGEVVKGHLLGKVYPDGSLSFYYHQINLSGQMSSGFCQSTPEVREDGRIRLHEHWQLLTGDQSSGRSVVEEV